MGKKDDWCSSKGRKARAKGMKEKESRGKKIAYCLIFGAAFIIYLVFGAIHASCSSNAMKISADFDNPLPNRDYPSYDSCLIPYFEADKELAGDFFEANMEMIKFCDDKESNCNKGTQWSGAFAFNAACLIITAINFVVMTFGACYFYPRYLGTMFNFCYACCHCAAFSMAIGVRFNPLGIWCSYNVAPVKYDADVPLNFNLKQGTYHFDKFSDEQTYQKDSNILAGLGVIQSILWCVQCCCCCLPLLYTPVGGDKDKDKKKDKKNQEMQMQMYPGAAMGQPVDNQQMQYQQQQYY